MIDKPTKPTVPPNESVSEGSPLTLNAVLFAVGLTIWIFLPGVISLIRYNAG